MEAAPAEGALEEAASAEAVVFAEAAVFAADRAEVPDLAVREDLISEDPFTVLPDGFTAAGIIAPTVTAMAAEAVSAG